MSSIFKQINYWLQPPIFVSDEDKTLMARGLHAILLTMSLGSGITAIPFIFFPFENSGRFITLASFTVLLCLGLYFLMRQGRVRLAGTLLIFGMWLVMTERIFTGGGMHSPALSAYLVLIISAGLLLGKRFGGLLTGLSALAGFGMVLAESNQLLPAYIVPSPLATWLINIVFFIVVAALQVFVSDLTREAVATARQELAERKLSEQRYRQAIEAIGAVPYVRDDLTKTYTFMGEGIYPMTGYLPAEVSPQLINSLIKENYMAGELAHLGVLEAIQLIQEGQIDLWRSDSRLRHRAGDLRWVSDRSVQIRDANKKLLGAVGVLQDITERKLIEEQLRTSLHEKELLLKEVHHRVKNNMQVIISLLSLQAANLTDPTTSAMMRESQNRVRAMALVHEKLYQSNNLGQIDLRDYLQHLATTLFHSYSPQVSHVELVFQIEELNLGIDQAIPCGLIANELISNSLKHAFPKQQAGQIIVNLRQSEAGLIELAITNNGDDFPASKDWRHTETLGLQLVQSLVKQLNGTMELTRLQPGTRFTISFARPK